MRQAQSFTGNTDELKEALKSEVQVAASEFENQVLQVLEILSFSTCVLNLALV